MEKLIKLLNEYNIELRWVDRTYKDGFDLWYEQEYMRDFRVAYLISKSFWFIKWLVDNNKINKRKIDTRLVRYVENHYDEEWYWVESSYEDYSDTNTLLMLLSISDTPIEDLISYLK
jgi:hypothetical protein